MPAELARCTRLELRGHRLGVHRVGVRLVKAQTLPLCPRRRGIGLTQAFPAGSCLLVTEKSTKTGAGRRLLGDRRRGQTGGSERIPFLASDGGKIIELQRNA